MLRLQTKKQLYVDKTSYHNDQRGHQKHRTVAICTRLLCYYIKLVVVIRDDACQAL